MTPETSVSVIVPVYQGMPTLGPCLDALQRQSYAAYEVIVVDNGDNEGIETLCKAYSKVRLCRHEAPGSYASRNAGIAISTGEILAFTDADCVPAPDWIRNAVKAMQQGPFRMASGRIQPSFACPDRPSTLELCDVILHTMDQEQTLQECTSVACANMIVHRSLFETIGLFNAKLYSAGDCEFTYRVRRSGEKIVYVGDAVVFHRARKTLKELSQRYRRFAGAEFTAKAASHSQDTVPQLRSLSFAYRIPLCIRNIVTGVRRHRGERGAVGLLAALLLTESYITAVKTTEYVRLSLGKDMQR